MDIVNKFYDQLDNNCKNISEKDIIISDLNNIKQSIIDVILYKYEPKELREKYKYPALLDKDNGILYARSLKNSNTFFLVIWKDNNLTGTVMEYNINAEKVIPVSKDENPLK